MPRKPIARRSFPVFSIVIVTLCRLDQTRCASIRSGRRMKGVLIKTELRAVAINRAHDGSPSRGENRQICLFWGAKHAGRFASRARAEFGEDGRHVMVDGPR